MTKEATPQQQGLTAAEQHYRKLVRWIEHIEKMVLDENKTMPGEAIAAAMHLRHQLAVQEVREVIQAVREQATQASLAERMSKSGLVAAVPNVKLTDQQMRGKS